MKNVPEGPEVVILNVGYKCNSNCIFCNNTILGSTGAITDLDQIIAAVGDLIEGCRYLNITGYGEVIINPNFKRLLDLGKGKVICIATNGYALTKDIVDYMLSLDNNYRINVSLNSLTNDIHNTLMGTTNRLDTILKNIEYISSYKSNRIILTVSMVVTALNIHEMEHFVKYAGSINADHVKLIPLSGFIDSPLHIAVEGNLEQREYLRKAILAGEGLNTKVQAFSFDFQGEPTGTQKEAMRNCSAPWGMISIDSNGGVYPCCWIGEHYGNVYDSGGWKAVWNGEKYTKLRNAVESYDTSYCSKCREHG